MIEYNSTLLSAHTSQSGLLPRSQQPNFDPGWPCSRLYMNLNLGITSIYVIAADVWNLAVIEVT